MKVAFSNIKITPKDHIGMPMAGYTRPDACKGKLDDIHAYGVLIEESENKDMKKYVLLISLDLLKIPLTIGKYIKNEINSKFNFLDQDLIFIHATHTHSAPDLTGEFYWPGGAFNFLKGVLFGINRNDNYIVWFTRKIVKMVGDLYNNLELCQIAWNKKPFNPKIVIQRRNPTKRICPELGVITFRSQINSMLIGIIINYACHPTTLSFLNNKLSADFPGRINFKINELSKGKVRTAYFNGPAGNINPITTSGIDFKKLEKNPELVYEQLGTYTHTMKIGYIIGEQALQLADSIPNDEYFNSLKISTHLKNLRIPLKDFRYFSKIWFKNKLIFIIKKHLLIPISRILNTNFPKFAIKHRIFKNEAKSIIQILRFESYNDKVKNSENFDILFVPGELYEELGQLLIDKSLLGSLNTFIFQNVNDWIGYLFPVRDYITKGGWEAFAGYSPTCGEYIKKEIIDLFRGLQD
ncbi:MAG: hypothetical protein ACFFE4_20190 [Candidatus Thorarchaeota archaeon]